MTAWIRTSLDLLFPPDPGALRLIAAQRATLAAALSFFLVMLLSTVVAMPITDRVLGFAIALYMAATVRDGTRGQRLVTTVLAAPAAFVSTALAALLLDQPFIAAAVVPLMMFAVIYGAARSPRYASLGTVALIAYVISLMTRQPPDTLPARLIVVLLAAGSAAFVRGVLLPERPLVELERLRHAVHAGVSDVLGQIAQAVEAGRWTEPARRRLRRDVRRLGDMIALAQARVAALPAAYSDQGRRVRLLLEVELGTERVARAALQDPGSPADRASLLATLQALQRGEPPPPCLAAGRLAASLRLLDHVLHGPPERPAPAVAPPPVTAATGLRPAFQTAIAAGLAIVGGDIVSPNRWYWAAFAAFAMFQGTRSRSESIAKGVQFMIGTLAGVVVGMVAATFLSGHDLLTMAVIIVAVFLAFQANVAAYGVMMFWITVILGLMFGTLGYFPPDQLLVRLQEAAIGAGCGALVASLVLVRRDRAATPDAIIAFLRALGPLVDSAVHALVDGSPAPDLAEHILTVEQRFRDLSAIAQSEAPRGGGLAASRDAALRTRMLLLDAIEQWACELGHIGQGPAKVESPALIRSMRQTVVHIAATLSELIERLAAPSAARPIDDEPDEDIGQALDGELSDRAAHLLLRIDTGLTHLASR